MPGSAGPRVPVSKPSRRYCSQLYHLGGGPYWDCFSLLRSYQAWSNQLTCDKDPDIRQTSRPKTAGTKLPKGPISRDEGDFLTLQKGPRKGFSPVLPRALAGAYWLCHAQCGSPVFKPHMVFTLSFNIAVTSDILQHWQWQSVGYGPVKAVKICFHTSSLTGLSKCLTALPLCLDG